MLVATTITRRIAPAWIVLAGYSAATLIATGVLVPVGAGVASITNFAGYVIWCLWLLAMAVILWRSAPAATATADARPRGASHVLR
ncbi:MAG TPA: hypothetical protein VHM65_02515 [Candidatus Lustribacter sp.]|nr:hypothetical protein [Candidatus Lustribacter sp.]